MYGGIHQGFVWDLSDNQLTITSTDRRLGILREQVVHNCFNNAEHATWFAQAQIDTQLEELNAILAARRQAS